MKPKFKVVKLNRTHKAFNYGFTYAFRFNGYSKGCCEIEDLLRKTIGKSRWLITSNDGQWYANYGFPPNKFDPRIYWINLVNESDVTLILLSLQHPQT